MDTTQVLVVGAGPTGLVMAIWLARAGVSFRIVDKHDGPGEASRAMAVQARTLEFYRQLGFDQRVLASGIPMNRFRLREGGREVATVELGEVGHGVSPYNFALSFPQDDHERLLVAELARLGKNVEWGTELKGFEQTERGVRAALQSGGAARECNVEYLCGCDGARSTVRQALGLEFAGGTYEQLFFVADVQATGLTGQDDVNLFLGQGALYAVFPVRRPGMQRLIGTVPRELIGRQHVTFDDLRRPVEDRLGVRITQVNWFSTYHVHHRVTQHFRVGRVFVSGDAAHVHSPVGGQGMNTGIGDALNLAWKLAAVLQGRAVTTLLDTYEPERSGFAHSLVATTDRLFEGVVGTGIGPQLFRKLLLPHVIPLALGFRAVRKAQFRLVSQTHIHYPDSPLSAGKAGDVQGGDRLPWVHELDNFQPLKSLDWQLHVYGQADDSLRRLFPDRGIPLHVFPWTDSCDAAGLERDAFYLVRPDGYVAVAGRANEASLVTKFCQDWGLVGREHTPAPLS